MSLYQKLADRPLVTNSLTVAVLLGALAFIAHDVRGQKPAGGSGQIYFTVDDGKTWFADRFDKLPPFDVDGRPAVRAYVYAATDGTPFVAYLERYTPQTLKEMARLDPNGQVPIDRDFVIAEGTEIKRPGDAAWVKRASPEGEKLLDIKPPDGHGFPKLILPGD